MKRQRQTQFDLKRGWPSLILSIAFVAVGGILFWAMPFGQSLERQFGLEMAFWLRGETVPPGDATYIPLDQYSADQLCAEPSSGLSLAQRGRCSANDLSPWARPFLATLIDRLADAGASVIVLDVNFFAIGDTCDDRRLAKAVECAGNVVLLSDLEQRDHDHGLGVIASIDQLHPPAPLFESAASATAPMALRRDARRDRFFTFATIADRQIPTLPAVALYMHQRQQAESAAWRECAQLERIESGAGPHEVLEQLRKTLVDDGSTLAQWQRKPPCAAFLQSPAGRLVTSDAERYFNFYRGLGTFRGPSFHDIVGQGAGWQPSSVHGKAVFIGVDDRSNRNPDDSHGTAVGETDFSGVELVTTAFVNLLHGQDIKQVSPLGGALLLVSFTLLIGMLFLLPLNAAFIAAIVAILVFAKLAGYRFGDDNLLLPMVIPLFIQAPLMIALGWRWQLGKLERVVTAMGRFVPDRVKDLIKRLLPVPEAERLFGVCMHTDVAGYTTLSEKLASDPMQLRLLEREYWALIDAEIEREHGQRFEISGDGMLCVWATKEPDTEAATRACRAALAILRVVDVFNRRHPETPFVTRIGIHAGDITIGPVGGGDRFTMTVGGDVPNTAARIENDVNKLLGTRLLISEITMPHLAHVVLLRVGDFILRGKNKPVVVYEVMVGSEGRRLAAEFEHALRLLAAGKIALAHSQFEAISDSYPGHGASGFYARMSSAYLAGHQQPAVENNPALIDLNQPSRS